MYIIEQTYDLKSLTVLCRAARKTVRRTWRFLRIGMWAIFALGCLCLLALLAIGSLGLEELPYLFVMALMLALLLLEDRLNAWLALRQLVPGTAHSTTTFTQEAYTVRTDSTETRWLYDNITALCETQDYFIFFLGKRHGQLFDKQGFRQGNAEGFRAFVEGKTGKTFQRLH